MADQLRCELDVHALLPRTPPSRQGGIRRHGKLHENCYFESFVQLNHLPLTGASESIASAAVAPRGAAQSRPAASPRRRWDVASTCHTKERSRS